MLDNGFGIDLQMTTPLGTCTTRTVCGRTAATKSSKVSHTFCREIWNSWSLPILRQVLRHSSSAMS